MFRTTQILEARKSKSPIVIIERSLFSERYCFIEVKTSSKLLCIFVEIFLDAKRCRSSESRRVLRSWQILFLVDEKHLVNNFSGKDCLHQKWPWNALEQNQNEGQKGIKWYYFWTIVILKLFWKEEKHLTTKYLKTLHEKHNEWLEKGKHPIPAPVDIFDGNKNLDEFTKDILHWAAKELQ